MKSLEEVIKYKLNFLPEGIEPFYAIQTYTPERESYAIYKSKNVIFSNDSLSFLGRYNASLYLYFELR